MIKILITGSNGFIGHHLKNYLLSNNYEVVNLSSKPSVSKNSFSAHPLDAAKIHKVINEIRPDQIYHLAGSTTNDEDLSQAINYEFCRNIIHGIELSNLIDHTRFLVLGSAAEYGYINKSELPVNEAKSPTPFSVYGLNKLRQTNLVLNWSKNHFGQGIVLRPFTVLGPGMSRHLAIGNFEAQLIDIYKERANPIITTGNLDSYRDYIDVNDFIRIMHKVINEPKAIGEVVNVCTGIPVKIGDILNYMIRSIELPITTFTSNNQIRKDDMLLHYGSNQKLHSLLKMDQLRSWRESIDEIILRIRTL